MANSLVFRMVRNDLLPALTLNARYADGTPVVLTGATSPKFYARLQDAAGAPKVNGTATIVDGPNGIIRYQWAGADTDTAGTYDAEFEVLLAGARLTLPTSGQTLTVVIREDVA